MNPRFDFRVEDIFHLGDGRTAFVGTMVGGPNLVRAGRCEVVIDGQARGVVSIEGEMLFSPSNRRLRSISTNQPFPLDRSHVAGRDFLLRSIGPAEVGGTRMHRHLFGLESPPEEFVADPLSIFPSLPEDWDGDAWVKPIGRDYFLRAWNKGLGRVAYGRGPSYEEAHHQLLEDLAGGMRSVEVTVRESSPA